jgi:periplasmic protein TonB
VSREDVDIPLVRITDLALPAPRLPRHRWAATGLQLALSTGLHLLAASALLILVGRATPSAPTTAVPLRPGPDSPPDVRHFVFIARDLPGGGGGGGGNRQAGPIRHAEAIGSDKITVRIGKPLEPIPTSAQLTPDLPVLPQLLLDAMPLASGNIEQVGLPVGGVSFGTSTGTGSGGGVGEGTGTGIGSGSGPGVGPGSGGGFGGGVYRPGGAVTVPRVITEVKPKYTDRALRQKIQGSIVLELVVKHDGHPSEIRVVRSLDPDGLDEQAVLAASQWRFEPGRLAGTPVDVLVTLVLDFSIR